MENMTDKQFDKILKMVSMILDGCKDPEEAKQKVAELLEDKKRKGRLNSQPAHERGRTKIRSLKFYHIHLIKSIIIRYYTLETR